MGTMARPNSMSPSQSSRRGDVLFSIAIILVPAVGGAIAAYDTQLIILLGSLAIGTVMFIFKPAWFVPATLILSCTALPASLPSAFNVSGFNIPVYEITLAIAFVIALRVGIDRYTRRNLGILSAWLVIGTVIGLLAGASAIRIIGDIRNPLQMVTAFVVAAAFVNTPISRECAEVMKWVLWLSSVLILLASTTGLKLAGRSEAAALGGAISDVTRYLTAATFPALATLCVCVSLALLGNRPLSTTWMWTVPSVLILVMAFSRNHLLALGVVILATLLSIRNARPFMRASAGVLMTMAGLILVVFVTTSSQMSDIPGMAWLGSQIDGYTARVVEGVSSEALRKDPSALYRERENDSIKASIEQSPILGHGFGYAYQGPASNMGTWGQEKAPYYAHNFYLWAMVKTGVIGLLFVLAAIAFPILRAISRPLRSFEIALAATAAGMLAVSFVAPMPLGSPTAVILGALVGAVCGLRSASAADDARAADQSSHLLRADGKRVAGIEG